MFIATMASTPTPTPTLFSESQRATLRALIDTVLAPLTEQEVASIVREKADLPHLKDAGVTRQQIESFLRTKGSDIPGLLASVENCLQKHAPADVAWELGMLLKVMGTSAGMLALTTSPSLAAPFQDLTSEQRQQVLAGFADSLIAAKRKAFVSLKQFICLQAFGPGPNNALWPAIGYSGPRPSAEVMRDAELGGRPEKDYRPYLLDVESLFKPGADHATIRDGEYDAVVIGSGCGGSVVAARLAENGHRVLVLEKGDFCPREELTGTEADFDRTFERGAIATTEVVTRCSSARLAFVLSYPVQPHFHVCVVAVIGHWNCRAGRIHSRRRHCRQLGVLLGATAVPARRVGCRSTQPHTLHVPGFPAVSGSHHQADIRRRWYL